MRNFSTDLLRISYWIYVGNNNLVKKFITLCKNKYDGVPKKIGCYRDIWEEIEKIERMDGGKYKAAERASTASVILFHNS